MGSETMRDEEELNFKKVMQRQISQSLLAFGRLCL